MSQKITRPRIYRRSATRKNELSITGLVMMDCGAIGRLVIDTDTEKNSCNVILEEIKMGISTKHIPSMWDVVSIWETEEFDLFDEEYNLRVDSEVKLFITLTELYENTVKILEADIDGDFLMRKR